MRFLLVIAALAAPFAGFAGAPPRHPPPPPDECKRAAASCEGRCDTLGAAQRLSCKTDCRMAESRCRSGRRQVPQPSP